MRGAASHFYVLWLNLRKHDLFFLRFFKMVSLCWYEAGFCVSSFMNIVLVITDVIIVYVGHMIHMMS